LTKAQKFVIECIPPFNFELSVSLFSGGDRQIRKYEKGKFWQIIRIDGQLALITLKPLGTVDQPRIAVELESNDKISREQKNKAKALVTALLNTQFDLNPFYEGVASDKILTDLTKRLRGLRIPSTPTVFEALVDSIIEQQISLDVAHVLETNLIKAFGDSLSLNQEVYYAYPTPKKLASANIKKLRGCGLSTRKAEYIIEISKMIARGNLDLESYKDYDDAQEIIEELDKIRGIGVWTAELTIMRAMNKNDVIPADDLGLRRVIAHFYCNDKRITGEEARRIAEEWGKWKGLACFYLMVAEAMEEINKR
jgi:DNA-3-methyladenine glycosylase II